MDPLSSRSPVEHREVFLNSLRTARRHLDKSGIENRIPVEAPLLHDLKSLQRLAQSNSSFGKLLLKIATFHARRAHFAFTKRAQEVAYAPAQMLTIGLTMVCRLTWWQIVTALSR